MAKPPRQTGKRVALSVEAAKRIGRAVLTVEAGDRNQGGTRLRSAPGDDALVRGTFSGSWAKGAEKEVTDATLSAVKYKAKNYVASLLPSGTMGCQIAYVAGEWVLVAWDWSALSGYSGSAQQILAHNTSGQLVWLSTTACT
jgi:hypothetical protein